MGIYLNDEFIFIYVCKEKCDPSITSTSEHGAPDSRRPPTPRLPPEFSYDEGDI